MATSFATGGGYAPETIRRARHAFFNDGQCADGLVEDAVLRSWTRCRDGGRRIDEPIEFTSLDRAAASLLIERNRALLDAARPELVALARSMQDAGYAVLLTDAHGHTLAVEGAMPTHCATFRNAFRPGVDLSERAIGSNAMSIAMAEQQTVRLFGPEHFFADTQLFHCCAAPVFDPQGNVVGAVDVGHDAPNMSQAALWLAQRCAQRIERRMFMELPAYVRIGIDVGDELPGAGAASTAAWLALDEDGQLIAASRAARQLIGLPPSLVGLDFGALFDARFHAWAPGLRLAPELPLRLQNGMRLRAQPLAPALARAAIAPARSVPSAAARPCFGDARLDAGFDRAARALRAALPVLLSGETGCGKDVTARALHQASERAAGPFVALNCAAIPGELLAGELFGHVDGAYTGSRRGGAPGKIEAAAGGTLFLDEIGDMPLALQATLLRVLDSGEVVRLGSTRPVTVDLRIVCATHRDLRAQVADGRFREDLYYRIAGHPFRLLPLRERADFDALLDALVLAAGEAPERIGGALRQTLRAAPWPGNVRQLAHALRRAFALAEPQAPLTRADFDDELAADALAAAPRLSGAEGGLLQRAEDSAIRQALDEAGGNVTAAARLLGMGRATLYRRLGRQRSA
ncbi:sigma-54-dependent Fis family transcriptional regulator [Derxia lacustris]|uniref:sigma-54-dependent Fis family transcriptional regulator n=1 Tax=Derxia lacustris TaxID=764842 RepID=UPI000A1759F0|nr:sigma-54-dependent Fis family transcriptional regulator [Derxia lacustris]